MAQQVVLPAWPSTVWTPLNLAVPHGFRFLNYLRGPTSFVGIREMGSNEEFRLYLGRPFAIDASREYEIRNCGFLSDGPIGFQANITNALDATLLANGLTAAQVGDPRRVLSGETVIVASEAPIDGGFLRVRVRTTWAASGTSSVFKTSTLGLDQAYLQCFCIGTDTVTSYLSRMPADASAQYALAGGWYLSGAVTVSQAAGSAILPLSGAYQPSALSAGSNTGVGIGEMAGAVCAVSLTGTGIAINELVGRVAGSAHARYL